MSQYMQIDIRVISFTEKRFADQFPNVSDLFIRLSRAEPIEKELSIYELIDHLVSINNDPATPTADKEKISPFIKRLLPLKKDAREHLLSRSLNELDQLLYRIEDEFEELENIL